MKKNSLLVLSAAVVALLLSLVVGAADGQYSKLTEIKIGGGGNWDYLHVDVDGRRLYVAHGTEVNVIDVDKDTVVGKITDTPGVHGFYAVNDLGRGFSSNGTENKASVVDLKTLATLQKIDTGGNPDALAYDSKNQEIYTFNGRGSTTIINVKTLTVVSAALALGGKPESGVVDTAVGRVYVNIEDKNEVAVIDTKTHTVVARWPIAPGATATGMAFDVKNHRLFIGCSNSKMIVMDSTDGKVIADLPVGSGVDAAAFDPGTGYAFASAGQSGNVTVVHQDSPTKYTVVQTLTTQPRSRTMTLDPKTHKIYLAAVDVAAAPAGGAAGGRGGRGGATVPDSFKVLVYGMK